MLHAIQFPLTLLVSYLCVVLGVIAVFAAVATDPDRALSPGGRRCAAGLIFIGMIGACYLLSATLDWVLRLFGV
jgi:hypothetical protein